MSNASFAAIAVSVAIFSLLLAVFAVQPALAQTQTVVIDCLPPWETNNRFLKSTRIKHPGLSLNGFDCGDNCDIGYGLKQVLEKVYGRDTETEVQTVFNAIIEQAKQKFQDTNKFGHIRDNTGRLQAQGFVALASYILENNDYDPTTLTPALPSASVAMQNFKKALVKNKWKLKTSQPGGDDGVKWATPVMNVARAIDFYLALENAYKYYNINEFNNQTPANILSVSQKLALMGNYTHFINDLENLRILKQVDGIVLLTRYYAEPGNASLKMQLALGYAALVHQEIDIENYPYDNTDTMNNYINRSFSSILSVSSENRYKYWGYQSNDGKFFWAEGSYYFHLTLSQVIPFLHIARINNLLKKQGYNQDPFRDTRILNPFHWLADISTPDGKTLPIDDGNKIHMYNASLLRWNSNYGNKHIGEKFAWIGKTASRSSLYPVEIAIPRIAKPMSNPLLDVYGNTFENKASGKNGRQEVVIRRTINGKQHYILLNGESSNAIQRGEGHEQGDQMQLLYYIDDTSYLVDSGYDTVDGRNNSTWNHYDDHNVMTLDPNSKTYSYADGGIRPPSVILAKRRKKSVHQSMNEIYTKNYGSIDLLYGKTTLNASPKGVLDITLNYQAFAHYYRTILFIQDQDFPYLVDINAVSGHNYNRTNWYDMLYHGNSEDTNILLNSAQTFGALRWSNIYKSSIIKDSEGTPITDFNGNLKSPKTNKKLYIRPFVVERSKKYPSVADDTIAEVHVSGHKGKGVPIKKLSLSSNGRGSPGPKENFTTVAFIDALPEGGTLRFRTVAQRPEPDTNNLKWQYFTRSNKDTTSVDVLVVRSAKAFADASTGTSTLYFPVPEADSFYVELAGNINYGFLRLTKKNNLWNIDPSFQINLKKSIPRVTISGPYCIKQNSTGHFTSLTFGGRPPYSYIWSSYRICHGHNSDSALSSAIPECNKWADNAGNTRTTDFGGHGDGGFRIRVKVTDSSSPRRSAISDSLLVGILPPSVNSCPNDIPEDVPAKTGMNNSDFFSLDASLSEANESIPETYALHQNFPNPFNPSTEILFDLPETTVVSLIVYDVLGREVVRLVDAKLPAGWHRTHFDGGNLPSGIYLYRIQAGNFQDTGRMLLIK